MMINTLATGMKDTLPKCLPNYSQAFLLSTTT